MPASATGRVAFHLLVRATIRRSCIARPMTAARAIPSSTTVPTMTSRMLPWLERGFDKLVILIRLLFGANYNSGGNHVRGADGLPNQCPTAMPLNLDHFGLIGGGEYRK